MKILTRMAKGNRKRFNKSGRDQSLKTTVQSNVKILDGAQETHTENDSNALVIERKKVVTQKAAPVARKLSKKKRKQLEKLLDQKEKKKQRGSKFFIWNFKRNLTIVIHYKLK